MGLGKTIQVILWLCIFFFNKWFFSPHHQLKDAYQLYWISHIKSVLASLSQAVTYLALLKYLHDDPGPHLIVCPASVLENWERELKKWCPSFSVLQFHGAARSTYSKELSSLSKAGLPCPFNVILVCYSLFERHR